MRTSGTPDAFTFSVPGGALTSGTWVGLRCAAEDAAGNSVEQTLLRLPGLLTPAARRHAP
ncbi:hypothetical protein [Streptomyces sp. NPDC058664]|uniref:hypothetical protein n=1 Tax=unclassified Streptomyces TaxID=2593676 RepID=UPI003668192E